MPSRDLAPQSEAKDGQFLLAYGILRDWGNDLFLHQKFFQLPRLMH